jgi:hypothetical protein
MGGMKGQCICIKFNCKFTKNASEMQPMLKTAFSDYDIGKYRLMSELFS